MLVAVGTGLALTVNVWEFEVPPPGVGLKTVMVFEPVVARSVAGIDAVSCVGLTNVVVLSDPTHRTTEPAMKFVPLTVSVKAPSPTKRLVGERLDVVGTGFAGATTTAFASVKVLLALLTQMLSEYPIKYALYVPL